MKDTEFKGHSQFIRNLFKLLSINDKNIKLNGSYHNSYWASDIDLYEKIKLSDLPKLENQIHTLSKDLVELENSKIIEIKIQMKDDKKHKYFSHFDKIKFNDVNVKDIAYIKIDILIYYLIFPMECSIIYNLGSITKDELIDLIVKDIEENGKEYSKFKLIKRIESVLKVTGKEPIFQDIINNTEIGTIYMSMNRINTLKENKRLIKKDDLKRYYEIIQEDLTKYGLNIKSNLKKELNNRIEKSLKTVNL